MLRYSENPNLFLVEQSGNPVNKDNSLYLTIKKEWFQEIIAGRKDKEYRDLTPTTENRYLEKENGDYYCNDSLPQDYPLEEIYIDTFNDGIFGFVPRDFEYLRLAVGYRKDRQTAVIKIRALSFEPIFMDNGQVLRFNWEDIPEDEELLSEKGWEAYYNPKGKNCFWRFVIHLDEIVELDGKPYQDENKFGQKPLRAWRVDKE